MNENIYGTLKVFFYMAQPPHPAEFNGRVRHARRTLFTAYGITQGDAEIQAREVKELNGFAIGHNGLHAQWQANPVTFYD